ncbi:MAG: hypothetical protein NTW59_00390, partial [Candidatus Diapherotrites archaeon]|nr:hypothetical protein [Candidatus Diapherotrites archaeon]
AAANSCFAGRGLSQAEALANCCVKYDNIEGQTVYSCALHNTVGNLQESHESGNQACIQKYYPDKYWGYVAAFNNSCVGQAGDTCWKAEATKLGIDTAKISQCAEGTEGIKMLIADSGTADQYSIGTSPTLMINGVAYDGSTSSSGYKDAICSAFNTPPAECSQAVSAGSSVNTNASCG